MTAADLPRVREWRNHPEIRRYMFTQHEIGAEEHANWFARAEEDDSKRLLIFECEGFPRGFTSLGRGDGAGAWDWGFYVSPDAPRGTGRQLGRCVLNFAFGEMNIRTLRAQVLDDNLRSISFHRSLGFRQDGVLPKREIEGAAARSVLCFSLSRDDWALDTKRTLT